MNRTYIILDAELNTIKRTNNIFARAAIGSQIAKQTGHAYLIDAETGILMEEWDLDSNGQAHFIPLVHKEELSEMLQEV